MSGPVQLLWQQRWRQWRWRPKRLSASKRGPVAAAAAAAAFRAAVALIHSGGLAGTAGALFVSAPSATVVVGSAALSGPVSPAANR
eukprot:CAMPEP_0202783428 /NCGR_PEP_ID=MMETSP1388-20130828/64423_1 /ASSEMBLY_ACC=CAM_ASM_000864 /TAXON_ID=37098 /ORGANISM="Isochrysis sp, Strain CCMP1244" /LENGTH=85 /DNA_ID=CAMNT_0049452891 /DNA_START=299 /DNA_END=557 /DNA_ORIENTATION=-